MILASLIQILPNSSNSIKIEFVGGRKIIRIPARKYEALRSELEAEKIYIAYEDEKSVVLVGFNGNDEPKMMKVPRALIYGDVKALIRAVFPFRS